MGKLSSPFLIITLVVIFAVVHPGKSLKCYVCNSEDSCKSNPSTQTLCPNPDWTTPTPEETTTEETTETPTESTTTESPSTHSTTTESPATNSTTTESPPTNSTTTESPPTNSTITESTTTESNTTESTTTESTTTESTTTESTTTESTTTESTTTEPTTTESTTTESTTTESTTTESTTTESTTTKSTTTVKGGSKEENEDGKKEETKTKEMLFAKKMSSNEKLVPSFIRERRSLFSKFGLRKYANEEEWICYSTKDSDGVVTERGCALKNSIKCEEGIKCCTNDLCNNANVVSISKITLICLILSWAVTYIFTDFH